MFWRERGEIEIIKEEKRNEIRNKWVCNSKPKPAHARGGGGVITYSLRKSTTHA